MALSIHVIVAWLLLASHESMANPSNEACVWRNQTASYDELCAEEAARYSSVAYESNLRFLYEWQCASCKHSPELYILDILDGRKGDYYGYIGYQMSSPDILILSFRGTVWLDGDSAIADLKFREKPWPENAPNSTVHHGFLDYYLKVQGRVRDIVASRLQKFPGTKLILTGHSLGGAAAIIASVDLSDIIPESLVYTFGSPRVGNSYFAKHVIDSGIRVFRVNHDHDLVPHLPPCTLSLFAWDRSCKGGNSPTHAPTEILYNKLMTSFIECSNADGEDRTCSDSYSAISYSIKEHLFYFGFNLAHPEPLALHSAVRQGSITI